MPPIPFCSVRELIGRSNRWRAFRATVRKLLRERATQRIEDGRLGGLPLHSGLFCRHSLKRRRIFPELNVNKPNAYPAAKRKRPPSFAASLTTRKAIGPRPVTFAPVSVGERLRSLTGCHDAASKLEYPFVATSVRIANFPALADDLVRSDRAGASLHASIVRRRGKAFSLPTIFDHTNFFRLVGGAIVRTEKHLWIISAHSISTRGLSARHIRPRSSP